VRGPMMNCAVDWQMRDCQILARHDWKSCPFRHPGEEASRRHPSVHTATPCQDYRRNKRCRRGNECPYAHGPWEAGLRSVPTQKREKRFHWKIAIALCSAWHISFAVRTDPTAFRLDLCTFGTWFLSDISTFCFADTVRIQFESGRIWSS
jgi:hypothetical protein